MKLGDAILCYNLVDDAKRAVESGLAHPSPNVFRMVFDNSDDFQIGEFMLTEHPETTYVRSPVNVGCCISRNVIAARMIREGCTHWVVRDQDVEILADGWLDDMLAVFQKYPDTGIVSWDCIPKQLMAHYDCDETGLRRRCQEPAAWFPQTAFVASEAGIAAPCSTALRTAISASRRASRVSRRGSLRANRRSPTPRSAAGWVGTPGAPPSKL